MLSQHDLLNPAQQTTAGRVSMEATGRQAGMITNRDKALTKTCRPSDGMATAYRSAEHVVYSWQLV